MYENITSELRAILEPRLDLFYLTEKNFYLKSLSFKEIDDLVFDDYSKEVKIVFLLDENYQDLKYTDNLRKLLSRTLVFTDKNLFKIFGVPERFFIFNAVIDEREYFISNNSARNVLNEDYVYEKSYSGAILNDIIKITVPEIQVTKENKNKLFVDILKSLCCGCNVYINSSDIKDLLPENIKSFLNLDLSEKDKLDVQFEIHKNYSYIIQVSNIEQQLYGIFGSKYDLITQQ
jgi:hypothetical protein